LTACKQMVALSAAEVRFIQGGIAHDLRSDGRGRYHFRPFSIQSGVIPQANGSGRCKLGATDVIASVKAELGRPPAGRPNHGSLVISVECSPTAAPEFEVHLTLQFCSDHHCSVFILLGHESSSHPGGCNNLKGKFLFLLEFCQ
jgi:hypothetical protein